MKERKNVSVPRYQGGYGDGAYSDSRAGTCQRGEGTFGALISAGRGLDALLNVLKVEETAAHGDERRLSRSPWTETLTAGTVLCVGSSHRTVLYTTFHSSAPYRNPQAYHEWVVIVLRIRPSGFRECVAIRLRPRLALLRLVVNLGHDVCEGRVRRYNTSSHQGRQRMEGMRGNMIGGGGTKGKRAGRPKEPSRYEILDILVDYIHLGKFDEQSQIRRRVRWLASSRSRLMASKCFTTKTLGSRRTQIYERWDETELEGSVRVAASVIKAYTICIIQSARARGGTRDLLRQAKTKAKKTVCIGG